MRDFGRDNLRNTKALYPLRGKKYRAIGRVRQGGIEPPTNGLRVTCLGLRYTFSGAGSAEPWEGGLNENTTNRPDSATLTAVKTPTQRE